MKNKFDKMLLIFWEAVFFVVGIFAVIIWGMFDFFLRFFFRGRLRKSFKIFFLRFSSYLQSRWRDLKRRMRSSATFCRAVSALVFVFLLLYLYPPISWGRWVLYERGIASYYGWGFYCRASASGEIYWPWKYAAAHKSLPLGTVVKVRNLENGKTIYVRIFDRGPFVAGRIIDLTRSAGKDLGIVEKGLAEVEIYVKD